MRRVRVEAPGPSGEFVIGNGPEVEPGESEVVVEVEAAGLAFADLMMCSGTYPGTPRGGFTPGYDVVGHVRTVGAGESPWAVGDRVAGLTVRGGLAERTVAKGAWLVPVPADLDATQVACLPLNYLAAWQMLHRVAKVRTDATVLVFGAGGGVGTALCELAVGHGCRVIGVARKSKHDQVTKRGALPVESRTGETFQRIRELAGEGGVDVCYDPVGGAQLSQGWRLLGSRGQLVSFGFAGSMFGQGSAASVFLGSQFRMAMWRLFGGRRRIYFYSVEARLKNDSSEYREDLAAVVSLLSEQKISPKIDSVVQLESVPDGYRRLRRGAAEGKIVVTIGNGGMPR